MNGAPLWRGYWHLLASASAAAFVIQINLSMVARLDGRASGAYAILMRITVLDVAVTIACAAVAAIALGHAQKNGEAADAIEKTCALALALGTATATLGYFAYPVLLSALMGDAAAAPFVGAPIFWFVAGAPFRVLANTQGFLLHALGRGGSVLAWRLTEIPVKVGANVLFMNVFEFGFAGCFVAGFIVTGVSSIWLWSRLKPHGARKLRIPEPAFTRFFLNGTFWEALRVLSPQAAMLFSLTLFSLPWQSGDGQRLDSYAAGQTFMLFILGPLITLTRFLAIRLPSRSHEDWTTTLAPVIRVGAPIALTAAIALTFGRDWIGATFYRQHGDWWSVFVAALAFSLPIRFAGGVVRGLALARRSFAKVAFADGLAQWLVSPLLVLLGLSANRPEIVYQSLIWPEVVGVFLIWRGLRTASEAPLSVSWPFKGPVR
ncbi:MAG: multi antimicrobial extrusion protein MatE [Alphaproteobacteria bacterium]|nr:multi antimicrobial extrusion protein MatE [Alphaproteobacteria bacterium]MBM3652468.1 multi antimicrobial extrusion protein MatE [Alphaproteobacteria bacterium]